MMLLAILQLEPVDLRDVDVLMFSKGQLTSSRRGQPVKQLKPGVFSKFSIDQAVCKNKGFDGLQVVWECTAPHLPSGYLLRDTVVSCEGWSGPEDRYVVGGSCQLQYNIKRDDTFAESYSYDPEQTQIWVVGLFLLLLLFSGCLICCLRKCCIECCAACCRDHVVEVPVAAMPPPPRFCYHWYNPCWWWQRPHVYYDRDVYVRRAPARRVYIHDEAEEEARRREDNRCYATTEVR